MSTISDIQSSLDIADVMRFYGVNVGSGHKNICCPIHDDRTPSLKIYADTNTYYCFGCHSGGDIVDFVKALFSISTSEAIKRICEDFGLQGGGEGGSRFRQQILGDLQSAAMLLFKWKDLPENDIKHRYYVTYYKQIERWCDCDSNTLWNNREIIDDTTGRIFTAANGYGNKSD